MCTSGAPSKFKQELSHVSASLVSTGSQPASSLHDNSGDGGSAASRIDGERGARGGAVALPDGPSGGSLENRRSAIVVSGFPES